MAENIVAAVVMDTVHGRLTVTQGSAILETTIVAGFPSYFSHARRAKLAGGLNRVLASCKGGSMQPEAALSLIDEIAKASENRSSGLKSWIDKLG